MVLPCAKRNTLRHCNTLFRNWNTLGSYRFIVSTFVGLDNQKSPVHGAFFVLNSSAAPSVFPSRVNLLSTFFLCFV